MIISYNFICYIDYLSVKAFVKAVKSVFIGKTIFCVHSNTGMQKQTAPS